jgi:hypothetical protein
MVFQKNARETVYLVESLKSGNNSCVEFSRRRNETAFSSGQTEFITVVPFCVRIQLPL